MMEWSGFHLRAPLKESHQGSVGRSISLSDDGLTLAVGLAVGAYRNKATGIFSGGTYVYWFDGTDWKQLGLEIDAEAEDDPEGRSVAISGNGNSVITGARLNDGIDENAGHARQVTR